MEFAMSKENIQPLRGGRNAAQLEVGLQAQHNPQYQEQLMLQKQQYENAIRTYAGDDPLENYYQYIYWVEQSFPKHGHEGNLVNLLEDCLGRFENDSKYQNDLRYCKLWIKYIDMQLNNTELYQLLYAKRIGIGCADMYKAWAYYYEAVGDFKRADQVYKLGKSELAQPFQELEAAYHNFVYSAGFRVLNNGAADTKRLSEQRMALTNLHAMKSGQVGSVRVPSSAGGGGAGILPMSAAGFNDENRTQAPPLNVYVDYQDILFGGGAPPVSILGAMKHDAPKENVMEAGAWTGAVKKGNVVHKSSNIPIHIDTPAPPHELGIQLTASHVAETLEDFSDFQVPLTLPEPEVPNQIPMYPKAHCYPGNNVEFSIEEVRAKKYLKLKRKDSALDAGNSKMETDILQRSNVSMECAETSSSQEQQQANSFAHPQMHQIQYATPPRQIHSQQQPPQQQQPQRAQPAPAQQQQHQHQQYNQQYNPHVHPRPVHPQNVYNQGNQSQSMHSPHLQHSMNQHQPPMHHQQLHHQPPHGPHYSVGNSSTLHHSAAPYRNSSMHATPRHASSYRHVMPYDQHSIGHQSMGHPGHHGPMPQQQQQQQQLNQHQLHAPLSITQHHHGYASPVMHQAPHHSPHPHLSPHPHQMQSPHHAYSQTLHPTLDGSAYNEPKTFAHHTMHSPQAHTPYHNANPMRTIADTQQAILDETGSPTISLWQNDDSPMVVRAQPPHAPFSTYTDSPATNNWFQPQIEPKGNAMKTPIKILSDDELAETGSRGGLDVAAAAQPTDGAKRLFEDEDSFAANTEVFRLNAMHVSTPQGKQNNENAAAAALSAASTESTKKRLFLSDIMEEASNFQSSGSSGCTTASARSGSRHNALEPITETSYHFNLSQNMKANAELRSKLLGMDCESAPESPVAQPPAYNNYEPYQKQDDYDISIYEDEPQQHVPYPVLNIQPTDPFTNKVLEGFLKHVNFPGRHRRSLIRINGVPKLAVKKDPCHVGNDRYLVDKLLGKGSYGNVYKATRMDTGAVVALKFQKPANKWEFYICKELQSRLAEHPLKECFMNVHYGYFSEVASVLVSDVHHGSLLNLITSIKSNLTNGPKHHLAIHLTSEMMKIVQAMHQVQIIHADIKPDNFLVMASQDAVKLQLIDFGCSIDMSLMPEGTAFMRKVKTDSFQCCEMKDDRPWNYHTDLFCIAATAHVMLFENYIEMKTTEGRWYITKKIPRYYREDLWSTFFSSMLNMQGGLADLEHLITFFADALDPKELRTATTYIINSFKNR